MIQRGDFFKNFFFSKSRLKHAGFAQRNHKVGSKGKPCLSASDSPAQSRLPGHEVAKEHLWLRVGAQQRVAAPTAQQRLRGAGLVPSWGSAHGGRCIRPPSQVPNLEAPALQKTDVLGEARAEREHSGSANSRMVLEELVDVVFYSFCSL